MEKGRPSIRPDLDLSLVVWPDALRPNDDGARSFLQTVFQC